MKNSGEEENRVFSRIPFKQPVQYQSLRYEDIVGCVASDLSEGGLRVNINHFVPMNTPLAIQIQLDDLKKVECLARVVWISKMRYSDRYIAGLEFDPESIIAQTKHKLHQFVDNS